MTLIDSPKILDAELKHFVDQNGDLVCSVIIDLQLSVPQMALAKSLPGSPVFPPQIKQTLNPEASDAAESEKRIDEVRQFLEGILAKPPVWLAASQVFAADVTPADVKAIAAHALVRGIRLNRMVRPAQAGLGTLRATPVR